MGLRIYAFNSGTNHLERVAILNSHIPDYLHWPSLDNTILSQIWNKIVLNHYVLCRVVFPNTIKLN